MHAYAHTVAGDVVLISCTQAPFVQSVHDTLHVTRVGHPYGSSKSSYIWQFPGLLHRAHFIFDNTIKLCTQAFQVSHMARIILPLHLSYTPAYNCVVITHYTFILMLCFSIV